jgi:hypothetical protein
MFGDPEFFDIEQKKLFGIWPHDQLIAKGISPYVKRIKKDKIAMLIVGDLKGESINQLLTYNNNIIKVNIINTWQKDDPIKSVYDKNIELFKTKIDKGISKDKKRDVVCIDSSACTLDNLELYYQNVKPGGIFCGNGHDSQEIKDVLTSFRRKNKIGIPIQVSFKTVWFWYTR